MAEDHSKTFGRRRSFAPISNEEIFALARQKVEAERGFLDPCLNRELLAEELNIHRNSLSAAVNLFAGVPFPVWVSTLRIAEVERLAAMPENRDCSISSLALRAGFSDRRTFHRVYMAIRGSKPSETLFGKRRKNE